MTKKFARFDHKGWYSVRKMNKDNLPQKRRKRHQKHTISYLYSFFLYYINNWDQKMQNSVFYEAFLPITWIKSSTGVTKYSQCMVSQHVTRTWHHDASRSSDAGWLACGLAKRWRITWLPHQGVAFFAFLTLLAWLYALLLALCIKIFKILWCSNKRVILSMKSVSLKFFDPEPSWSPFLESPGN